MELLSALSLAANVVQSIDFSCNLLSESRQIFQSTSGTSAENDELESVAKHLQEIIAPLWKSAGPNPGKSTISKVIQSCNDVAKDLLEAVEKLKVKERPHRKWRSFGDDSHNSQILDIMDRASSYGFTLLLSLRQGMTNGDNVLTLQIRLRSLHPD